MSQSPCTSISQADLDKSPAYQLWLVTNAWQRRARRALEPLGLTHTQFIILVSIDLLSGGAEPVTQAQVSRFAAIDENMTSQLMRTLEQNGLLERLHHPHDARARVLSLTEEGRNHVIQARKVLKPEKERMFECLGDRVGNLASMLAEVAAANADN